MATRTLNSTTVMPLWAPSDQQQRLEELTTDQPGTKELPLRRDVRSLGKLLGDTLREQGGSELLDAVEELRTMTIARREPDSWSEDWRAPERAPSPQQIATHARETISNLSLHHAYQIAKSFSLYFELTNLAETSHRKRRRRAAELHPERAPLPGSFRGTLLRMKAHGISAERVLEAMRCIEVVPVFTAHPTEVSRRTVLYKRKRIADQLQNLDVLPLTNSEASERQAKIRNSSPPLCRNCSRVTRRKTFPATPTTATGLRLTTRTSNRSGRLIARRPSRSPGTPETS